jgi:hypothetical protein
MKRSLIDSLLQIGLHHLTILQHIYQSMYKKRKIRESYADDGDDEPMEEALDSEEEEDRKRGFGEALKKVLQSKGEVLAKHTVGARRVAEEKQKHKEQIQKTQEKKLLQERGHVVPDMSTASYEKKLVKIATKGG